VLILAGISLYNAAVSHVLRGGSLGPLTRPILFLTKLPKTVVEVLKSPEIKGIPSSFEERDQNFEEINRLTYDLYGLNSFYNRSQQSWDIRLFDFKNDSIIHQWQLFEDPNSDETAVFANTPSLNPILLPDRQLIASLNNLYRLDSNSNIIWSNNQWYFHHAMNLDPDGNIWTCTEWNRGVYDYFGLSHFGYRHFAYRDDYITKIDAQTGEMLYNKSVSGILVENGYKNFVYGSNDTGPESGHGGDPIHLNDIQPVFADSKYWKKGDLFISIRHKSLVLLYRPETNKIIRLIYGPFLYQHDVDIVSDHEIAIFNNNIPVVYFEEKLDSNKMDMAFPFDTLYRSEILVYNFQDSTYRTLLRKRFDEEGIITWSEGFYEILSNGDMYVESQNQAKVFIMNQQEIVLKKQFGVDIKNMVERPNWIRIYEDIDF
jgi:hypothetical protein